MAYSTTLTIGWVDSVRYSAELFAAGGGHSDGDAEVVAGLAGAQLDRAGVKAGVKLLGNHGDGMDKTVGLHPHDLDGEK